MNPVWVEYHGNQNLYIMEKIYQWKEYLITNVTFYYTFWGPLLEYLFLDEGSFYTHQTRYMNYNGHSMGKEEKLIMWSYLTRSTIKIVHLQFAGCRITPLTVITFVFFLNLGFTLLFEMAKNNNKFYVHSSIFALSIINQLNFLCSILHYQIGINIILIRKMSISLLL